MNLCIPTSFRLGGHTWRVRIKRMKEVYGECDFDRHIIYIATFVDGKETTEETRYQTYLHECNHADLHILGRQDDEELVSGLEQMQWQRHKSARYAKELDE